MDFCFKLNDLDSVNDLLTGASDIDLVSVTGDVILDSNSR